MNAAVVKRTQEALGRVIRRPPLTEKLLNKPPFRYLHDIITEVIRMTGFMKGLYTDAEMKSDNVKDKDAKISFLQKAIDVVVMVSGEPLSAKPARIVAGHEPERTNELLQRIGRCCLGRLSSDEAVKRVLAGEKGGLKVRASLPLKPQDSDPRPGREEQPRAPKDREGRRHSEVKESSTGRDQRLREGSKEESKAREKDRDPGKAKEHDRARHRDPERDKGPEGDRERPRARPRPDRDRDRDRGHRDRDKEVDRERDRRSEAGREKVQWRDQERERERDKDRDKDKDRDRDRRRARNGEHALDPSRERSQGHDRLDRKSSSSGEVSKRLSIIRTSKDSRADAEAEVSAGMSRSMATKTSKQRSKTSGEGDSPSEAAAEGGAVPPDGDVGPAQDKSEVPEDSAAPAEAPSSIRIPRPGSARPAPPRVKAQDGAEVLTADRTGSGKTVSSVIMESQHLDAEEDDQFVVEAAPQPSAAAELEVVQAVELEAGEQHGGLVKKILETKKDYEKLQLSPRPGDKEKALVFESAWKEKDIVSKEIEKLRMSIQTLCKSALPLGRIMNYLQEDVDAMQKELQLWHSENKQHTEALQQEQSVTSSAVEPLKAELAELEQLIKDQQDKICAVKANILKNEEKIQKMVYGINVSSRR
ncbi:TRAF3-interacting protein 1 isoform X2 [Saccopteryx bilineata]|uniref:TRAF3-interacting protein 1 isoform X2 n=1 Tax=Saccopteryx bilineata TaxID=59482 RepID=UPI00338DC6E7